MLVGLLVIFDACSGSPPPPHRVPDEPAPESEPTRTGTFTEAEIRGTPDAQDLSMADIEGNRPRPACEPFDVKNPACRDDPRMCTLGHADCKCPSPPDVELPACWNVMPCPNPPDRRVRACKHFPPPCPDGSQPSAADGQCPTTVVLGRVIRFEARDAELVISVSVGSNTGVTKNWSATLLRGDTDEPLSNGSIQLVRIDKAVSVGTVHVDADTLRRNNRVRFTVP